jgi:thioredoxin 1
MLSNANVLEVDDVTFDREVLAAGVPVLVEIGAPWCPPCKTLAPIVERIARETVGRLKVVTVDTDACPGVSKRYGIRGVPTLLVFRGGEKTAQHLGATTRERILDLIGA